MLGGRNRCGMASNKKAPEHKVSGAFGVSCETSWNALKQMTGGEGGIIQDPSQHLTNQSLTETSPQIVSKIDLGNSVHSIFRRDCT